MTLAHGRGFGLKSWTRTAAAGTLFIFSSFSFASASSPIFCSDGLFYTLVAYVSLTVLAAVVIATFVLGNSEYGAELMRWLEKQGVSMNHKMHNFSESFARAVPPTAELNSWYIDEKDLVRIACIGQGNMGQVWFAKWNGTRVAVKTMLGNWEKDESMVERFKDEINLMCTLHHPNILMFIGAVVEPGNYQLVTEFCAHGDMYSLLHSDSKMTLKMKVVFGTDTARGMIYLHGKAGVIQRDLKAENLLIDDFYHVKIADFGLSRKLNPEGGMGTFCGTPTHVAPEIVKQTDYSEKADVFSFGIILWEMITRQVPYKATGLNGFALALKVAQEGLRPEVPAYCPEEIHNLMVRCWDEDEKVRPDFRTIMKELQDISAKVRRIQKEKRMAMMQTLSVKENWELEMELEGIGEEDEQDGDDDDEDGDDLGVDGTQIEMDQIDEIDRFESGMEVSDGGEKRALVASETASAESAQAEDNDRNHEKIIKSASNEQLERMIEMEREKMARLSPSVDAADVKVTVNDA